MVNLCCRVAVASRVSAVTIQTFAIRRQEFARIASSIHLVITVKDAGTAGMVMPFHAPAKVLIFLAFMKVMRLFHVMSQVMYTYDVQHYFPYPEQALPLLCVKNILKCYSLWRSSNIYQICISNDLFMISYLCFF